MAKRKPMHDSSKTIWIILSVVILVLAVALLKMPFFQHMPGKKAPAKMHQSMAFDFGNQNFLIDNQEYRFSNGYCKNPKGKGDAQITHSTVNASGTNAAAILVDNSSGSGTFYYVVGATKKDNNEVYSKPVLIGDRVNIVSVSIEDASAYNNGIIKVTYLDRAADESMASEPKQETTKEYAFQEDGNLIEVR